MPRLSRPIRPRGNHHIGQPRFQDIWVWTGEGQTGLAAAATAECSEEISGKP